MKQRNRQYVSHSVALTEQQIEALERYALYASTTLGQKISLSEIIRLLIDKFIYEQRDIIIQDSTRQDSTRQDSTRQDSTRQDSTRQDSTRRYSMNEDSTLLDSTTPYSI